MTRVLVPLAQGCEELEAVTIIDLLRRADIEVVAAGLDDGPVIASRGVKLLPDMPLDKALELDYDMVVLPGGLPGSDHLAADERVTSLLKNMNASGRFVGAVSAAPKVLARTGILDGKQATSLPVVLPADKPAHISCDPAIRDRRVRPSLSSRTTLDLAPASLARRPPRACACAGR